jgi:outer membrane lipoprotein-sorting protein
MYLPAFGRERRIASSAKNQNFAGTDFSYDDMESVLYSAKYTPKLLKTEADVFVLELTPLNRSDYSKVMVQVNKTYYYPEFMEYYDKGNTKVKEAKYSFKKIGNYWNASEIEMTDLKKNHKTKMLMSDVKYDTGLTDDDFTVRKLKQ